MSETTASPAPLTEPAPEEAASPAPPPITALIDAWHHDHFGSVPLGWDTPMTNHVRAAVDDLKRRLGA